MSELKFGKIEIGQNSYTVPQPVVDAVRSLMKKNRSLQSSKQDSLRIVDKDDINQSESPPVPMPEKLKENRATPFEWQSEEGLKKNKKALNQKSNKSDRMRKFAINKILNTLNIN